MFQGIGFVGTSDTNRRTASRDQRNCTCDWSAGVRFAQRGLRSMLDRRGLRTCSARVPSSYLRRTTEMLSLRSCEHRKSCALTAEESEGAFLAVMHVPS